MKASGYRRVPGSEGARRAFRITLGLRQGYGADGRIYDIEEAVRAGSRWMRRRATAGEGFLTGMFTRGEVVYVSPDDGAMDREPVAIFTGEVLHGRPGGDLPDDAIMALLDDLAAEIGGVLGQEDVHVSYQDRAWTLHRG
jgi:hypothetical protein